MNEKTKHRIEYSISQNVFHITEHNSPLSNTDFFTIKVFDSIDSAAAFLCNGYKEITTTDKQLFVNNLITNLFGGYKKVWLTSCKSGGKKVSNPTVNDVAEKMIRFFNRIDLPFNITKEDVLSALFMGGWSFSQRSAGATAVFTQGFDKETDCVKLSNRDISLFYALSNPTLQIYATANHQKRIKESIIIYFNTLFDALCQ